MNTIRKRFQILNRESDRGSLSVELVLLAPAILAIALFLIACGRIGLAQVSVEGAANAAVRDASLSRTAYAAQANATSSANSSISSAGLNCTPLEVAIDSAGLNSSIGQVGTVRATITCTLNLSDIALPGLPGTKVITVSATSPVDPYRERK